MFSLYIIYNYAPNKYISIILLSIRFSEILAAHENKPPRGHAVFRKGHRQKSEKWGGMETVYCGTKISLIK
jgi:hypothetical protein